MGVGGDPVCDRTLPGVAFSQTWGLRARSGGRDAEWTLETGSLGGALVMDVKETWKQSLLRLWGMKAKSYHGNHLTTTHSSWSSWRFPE